MERKPKSVAKKTNNKFYDISKATPLVTVEKTFGKKYGDNPDDDWTETLYRKPTGEFYVYGSGGKNSPYSVDEDGTSNAGSRYEIWLESNYNAARNWVHTNCPEKQEEIFVTEAKEEKNTVTSILISQKARMNLKRKSKEMGLTVSELIRQWAESLYK